MFNCRFEVGELRYWMPPLWSHTYKLCSHSSNCHCPVQLLFFSVILLSTHFQTIIIARGLPDVPIAMATRVFRLELLGNHLMNTAVLVCVLGVKIENIQFYENSFLPINLTLWRVDRVDRTVKDKLFRPSSMTLNLTEVNFRIRHYCAIRRVDYFKFIDISGSTWSLWRRG